MQLMFKLTWSEGSCLDIFSHNLVYLMSCQRYE